MKKEKRNRGLSSWNEKVALGLRKEKQLAFKATTHIHKKHRKWRKKNRSKCSASGTHRNKKMKRFLLVCKRKLI